MVAHINEFGRTFHTLEGSFDNSLGFAHERDDRAVGGLSRVNVEQTDAFDALDCVSDGLDYILITSLTEIWDTLYDSCFHG